MSESNQFQNSNEPDNLNEKTENEVFEGSEREIFGTSDEVPGGEEIVPKHSSNVIEEAVTENSNTQSEDIELDPDIENFATSDVGAQNSVPVNEPMFDEELNPPIMPQINVNGYEAEEKQKGNKGAKVFALVLSFLIVASSFMTVGYLFGNRNSSQNAKTVDLATKPKAEDALTVSEIYNKVNKSIVGIYVYNEKGVSASASGVIYSKDGYIVTNDHIYSSTTNAKFKIYTYDGKMYSAKFVAGDTRSDLAVLKIENAENLSPAVFGNSDELVIGETVVAIGRPNGADKISVVSEGVVSAKNTRVAITTSYSGSYIQTDTAINSGSSGGVLCNIYGQVVGITSAKLVDKEGVGYAIPTTTMKKNVELLIKHKYVKGRAKLGITYVAIDELTAEIKNIPVGLQIGEIDKSSDLYGKSVSAGDIITKVNGKEINSAAVILDIIDSKSAGETLTLSVYLTEKKKEIEISVKLLEDNGGSSYSKNTSNSSEEDKLPSNDDKDGEDSEKYNTDEFDFPIGE